MLTMLPVRRTIVQNFSRSLYSCALERKPFISRTQSQDIVHNIDLFANCTSLEHTVLSYNTQNVLCLKRHFTACQTLRTKGIGTRLVELAPVKVKPYLQLTRIDRPTGTLLLLWPGLWSICLAAEAGSWPSGFHICLFTLGTFLMRGAGCTINDMWDRKIDAKVERTKHRPLASGKLDPSDALGFLALQLGCATFILLQLDWFSILLGFSSIGLVVSYPLAKRYTNWPQLVLGLTFNWGTLMGWSAAHGASDWLLVLPLYVAAVSWTIVYDTIYAYQDRIDDAKLGLKSTALLFGSSNKKWLGLFGCSMLGNLLLTGMVNDLTWPFYASTGLVGLHLAAQIFTLDVNNSENCSRRFKSNATLGLILFLGLVTNNLLK